MLNACVRAVEEKEPDGNAVRSVYRDLAGDDAASGRLARAASRRALDERTRVPAERAARRASTPGRACSGALEGRGTSRQRGGDPRLAHARRCCPKGRASAPPSGRARLHPRDQRRGRELPGWRGRPAAVARRRGRDRGRAGRRAARSLPRYDLHDVWPALLHHVPEGLRVHRQAARRRRGRWRYFVLGAARGGARRQSRRARSIASSEAATTTTWTSTTGRRRCTSAGTAARRHREAGARCLHCGQLGSRVVLYAVRQNKDNPGLLTSCLSCGANGRRMGTHYREPARPVRATNVADVHVLAQDMVQHSERPRLLVFCDNRQDAAFQAGWMKDHARRFRLRALMAEALKRRSHVGRRPRACDLDDVLEQGRVAIARARPGGVAGRPPRGQRRAARAGAAEVPAHPGAARSHAVVAPGHRSRALGPDEGRVRGSRRVVAMDPDRGSQAGHAAGGPARRRRKPPRLPAPQAGSARPGAGDLHQVLDGWRPRGPAGLPPAGR